MSYSPWGHKESDTTERLLFTSLRPWEKAPLQPPSSQIATS